jgi:hypothetical protein
MPSDCIALCAFLQRDITELLCHSYLDTSQEKQAGNSKEKTLLGHFFYIFP